MSILIVSGSSYLMLEQSFVGVDHAKIITEIEKTLDVKFEYRFFMHGTDNKNRSVVHQKLSLLLPRGPQYTVDLFEKIQIRNQDRTDETCVEVGLDVAIATKIIEYGCAINNDNKAYNVVLVSDDSSLVRAIECVDNRKLATVKVIPTSKAIQAQFATHTHVNTSDGSVLYLDDIMRRCSTSSPIPSSSFVVSPSPLMSEEEVRIIEELPCGETDIDSNSMLKSSSKNDTNTIVGETTSSKEATHGSQSKSDHVLRKNDQGLVDCINRKQVSSPILESAVPVNMKGGNVTTFCTSLSDSAGISELRAIRMQKGVPTRYTIIAERNKVDSDVELNSRVLRETTEYLRIQRAIQVSRNVCISAAEHPNATLGLSGVCLRVSGAGTVIVNGDYLCVGLVNRAGWFERSGLDTHGRPVRFTIYKCLMNDRNHRCFVWFLSMTPGNAQPGDTQDTNYYFSVADRSTDKAPSQPWHSMSNAHLSCSDQTDVAPTVSGRRIKTTHATEMRPDYSSSVGKKRVHHSRDKEIGSSTGTSPVLCGSSIDNAVQMTVTYPSRVPSPHNNAAPDAASSLTTLFTDMFTTAPVDRVTQDIELQLTTLVTQSGVSMERAVSIGAVVVSSFKELHCLNRLHARKRGISLVCIEFITSIDTAQTACCKFLRRVYPALMSAEIERSFCRTLSKLGEEQGLLGLQVGGDHSDETDCVRAVMVFCEVLARCADIRVPFLSLSQSAVGASSESSETAPSLQTTSETCPPAVVNLETEDVVAPVVKKRKDQLLEKLFVALFQQLLPGLDSSEISVSPFSEIIDYVRTVWVLSEEQARAVCRAIYAVLSEMKGMDEKKVGERSRGEKQLVQVSHNNNARCVRHLMNVFHYLTEIEVKYFVQRLLVDVGRLNINVGDGVYRNALLILNKFCVLLSNWSEVCCDVEDGLVHR